MVASVVAGYFKPMDIFVNFFCTCTMLYTIMTNISVHGALHDMIWEKDLYLTENVFYLC